MERSPVQKEAQQVRIISGECIALNDQNFKLLPAEGTAPMLWNGLETPHPFPATTPAEAATGPASKGARRRRRRAKEANIIYSSSTRMFVSRKSQMEYCVLKQAQEGPPVLSIFRLPGWRVGGILCFDNP